ncbi:Protein of unknown function [Gryllus bimaculatus]|nr:Protein of unknown function [Gryllus bimaculatus]
MDFLMTGRKLDQQVELAFDGAQIQQHLDSMCSEKYNKKINVKKTEGLALTAQEQALGTKVTHAKIDKIAKNCKCRHLKQDKAVNHLVSTSIKMAQSDYNKRHDRMATLQDAHWHLCRKYGQQQLIGSGNTSWTGLLEEKKKNLEKTLEN